MNRDLGVWTNEDSALVLIDYQRDQFESIRSETPADLIELNTRWLAKAREGLRRADCAVDHRSLVRHQRPDPATYRCRTGGHRSDRPHVDQLVRE